MLIKAFLGPIIRQNHNACKIGQVMAGKGDGLFSGSDRRVSICVSNIPSIWLVLAGRH
jgi:hypothetical protein